MNRNTHICLNCRIGRRYLGSYAWGEGKCSNCGGELIGISDKFRIPKKNDKQGWKQFIEWLKNYNPWYKEKIKNFNKTLTK